MKKGKRKRPTKGSCVDDRFFKMADMESFLRREDVAEERRRLGNDAGADNSGSDDQDADDESDIDMFAEIPSSGEDDAEESGKVGGGDGGMV